MADDTVRALLERAATMYQRGEILAALADWEQAVAMDPRCDPAHRAISALRENYDLLDESLRPGGQALDPSLYGYSAADDARAVARSATPYGIDTAQTIELPRLGGPADVPAPETLDDAFDNIELGMAGAPQARRQPREHDELDLGTRPTEEVQYTSDDSATDLPGRARTEPLDEPGAPLSVGAVEIAIHEEVEKDAPASESPGDRTRRRVKGFIEHARNAHLHGDSVRAVIALELAFAEDPDSAISHKLLNLHRTVVAAIFETYLADFHAVPALNVPFHELAHERIDARAAFLLSRVDGVMTIENLLDVASMPRIESLHYLCSLVLRGILILSR